MHSQKDSQIESQDIQHVTQLKRQSDIQTNSQRDSELERQIFKLTVRLSNRQPNINDGHTERQAKKHTGKTFCQIDRQTDRYN